MKTHPKGNPFITPILFSLLALNTAKANNIIAVGTTTAVRDSTLWPAGAPYTFINTAAGTGGDYPSVTGTAIADFDRNFGALGTPGPDGTLVKISGIGWASANASSFGATNATVTITYNGADGVFGTGGDDVVIGTATDNVTANAGASIWCWVFTTPMSKVIVGTNSIFHINITRNTGGNMSFKTTTGATAANAKLSVSGTAAAYTAPPASTWTGTTDSLWSVANNWSPAAIPTSTEQVKFDSSSSLNLGTMMDQDFSPLGVVVSDPPAAVSIGGANSLTLGASGIDLSAAAQNLTITAPVVIGAAQNWNVATGRTLTMNGGVAGTGFGFNVTGPGTVSLGGINTYPGTTTVTAGKLLNGSSTAFSNSGQITVGGTGLFDLNGNNASFIRINPGTSTATITNTGAAAILTETNIVATVSNLVTGNLSVRMGNNNIGVPPFDMSSPNTFTGGLTLTNSQNGNGTRLALLGTVVTVGSPGAIVSSPFGTGPITIGEAPTDRAGFLCQTANNTLVNDVIFNTSLGFGNGNVNPGIRVDSGGNTLSGTVTAALADATISNNSNNGGNGGAIKLTGKVTGPLGFALTPPNPINTFKLAVTLASPAGTNDYGGNTTLATSEGAYSLVLGAADQIPNGAGKGDVVMTPTVTAALVTINATFDLNTFSETINGLSGKGVVDTLTGGSPVLTVGDANATSIFDGIIKNTTGSLALTKIGAGTLTLTGPNTYTGDTTVNGGVLATSGTSIPDTGKLVINGGKVEVTGTEQVSSLFFGGVQQATGTWGATDSGAAHIDDARFSGTAGVVNVVPAGYIGWATTNAPTGTAQNDFDGDGVTNAVEYVLGGDKNTNDISKLPKVTTSAGNFAFSFVRAQSSIDGTTAVVIQTGTTLATWPDTYTVPSGAVAANPGVTVVKDFPAVGFDTVTLTLPQTPDPIKFARLKVSP